MARRTRPREARPAACRRLGDGASWGPRRTEIRSTRDLVNGGAEGLHMLLIHMRICAKAKEKRLFENSPHRALYQRIMRAGIASGYERKRTAWIAGRRGRRADPRGGERGRARRGGHFQ